MKFNTLNVTTFVFFVNFLSNIINRVQLITNEIKTMKEEIKIGEKIFIEHADKCLDLITGSSKEIN